MNINRLLTYLFSISFISKKVAAYGLSIIFLICIGTSFSFAAPGDLDTSFGSNGKVSANTEARAMTLQPDGKIVLVGFAQADFVVFRYNANGSVDTTFGTNGRVIVPVGNNSDYAVAVAVQPDGKIIVVGYVDTTGAGFNNFGLVRLNPNGSLDTSFDADGKVITAVNSTRSEAHSVAVQADGKIVVAGSVGSFNSANFAVVRYNADGSLDTSFDVDGQVTTPVGTAFDAIRSVKVQGDGKIIATGQVDVGSISEWGLVRYNVDGSLDTTFDSDGKLIGSFRSASDYADALELQPDGKIVVAGGSRDTDGTYDFALARFTPNGLLDASFDTDGIIVTPLRRSSGADSVNLQSNGKIVTAGYSDGSALSSSRDFAVIRYNADASLDTSFGSGGTITTDIAAGMEAAFSSAIQTDGRIVVAGEKSGGHALVRYLGDSVLPRRAAFDFDGDNRTDYGVFRPSGGTWYLQQSTAGFAATAFGVSSDKPVPADFDGDGKTDVAVFRSGTWYMLRSNLGFAAISFGTANDVPVPSDFDGDGKAELAVFRPSLGAWYFLNLTNNQFSAVSFGQSGDKAIPADFDGDGKTDVAVFRPSNGSWYLLQSTNGFAAVNFGISSDTPIAADFDGDGRADQAVFRAGNWYLNRSSAGFAAVSFGVGSDKLAVGDYDGDGKADITVWRPESGVFYLLLSGSNNQFGAFAFGQNGDLPIANSFVP